MTRNTVSYVHRTAYLAPSALLKRLLLLVCFAGLGGALRRKAPGSGGPSDGGWAPCAAEGETVAQASRVRFGWGNAWSEEVQVDAGSPCALETFSTDPAPGIRKICECADAFRADSEPPQEDMGLSWSRCGVEGSECSCPSNATVRFGVQQRWLFSEPEPTISRAAPSPRRVGCVPASFGGDDPAAGQPKECWCEAQGVDQRDGTRVAIVMLTRRPRDLSLWLEYHLDYMGVDHVFIEVEDTPDFNRTWDTIIAADQRRLTAWRASTATTAPSDSRPANDYKSLQGRQMELMRRAKAAAADLGIDWLIHIDDDELLHAPFHRTLGNVLSFLPQDFSQAYIPNVEAIYPSANVASCFEETSEVLVTRWKFASYANGKAAVRVSDDDLEPAGPHMWRTSLGMEPYSLHLDREPSGSPLLVVHFESCPLARWEAKFWELGNASPEQVRSIPFPFYKESIQRMQLCGSKGSQANECSEASLRRLWSEWKTRANPKVVPGDVMPLRIPWGRLKSAAAARV